MHLTEAEEEKLFSTYFSKLLFQSVIMIVFPVSFALYIQINEHYSNKLFITSGLFTIIWLMLTGILIKLIYYFVTHKISGLNLFDYDRCFEDKEFFLIMCPLLYGVLFSLLNWGSFFTILSIVLGKYIWMDFSGWISLSDINKKTVNFFKESKSNILLLFCQASVMGYLLVRWYPVKDELINTEYIRITFVVLFLCLMPALDLLICQSLKSYSADIITERK